MKNSTIPPELEIDQQITTFSLGIVKNLFSKVGLSQDQDPPVKPIISIPRESTTTRDSIFSSPSSSQQPRRSSLRPSFTNSFEFWDDRLTLSPITEGSSRRSSSATPMSNMNKNDKREKLEFSIQIIDAEESPHAVSGISCFTDNLGFDQSIDYSYSLPSVVLTHREDFASRLYKQGCLWKKSTKLLVGWQKRYFEVKPYKISYASSPENLQKRHQVRSINLLVHLCELIEIKENTFTIKIEGIDKHLKLSCETFQETMEWVDFLKEFFKYAKEHCYKNGKYFRHQRKTLVKSDMFTEEDFLQEADTGDLLLFKSVASPCSSSNGKYSHIALVVKAFDDIYIYDTVNNKDVRLNNWKDFKFLKEYKKYRIVTFRKLHIDNPDTKGLISLRIYKNIMNRSGALSDPSLNTLFEKVILVPDSPENTTKRLALSTTQTTILSPNLTQLQASPLSSPEKVVKADEKMLSGQLIAALYKDIGLLDASMPVAKYLPSTFAKNLKLLKGGYLSSEYELVFLN